MKILALIGVLVMLSVSPLYANWGGDAGGNVGTGNFRASGTEQVEMVNENLLIRLYHDRARVQVEYVLKNTGKAVEVTAGFPCLGIASQRQNYLEIEDYKLLVDGKLVPHQTEVGDVSNWKTVFDAEIMQIPEMMPTEQGSPCRIWWLSSTVHFDAGQTRHVKVEYESLYEFSEGGPSDDCYYNNDYFRYLLSTAAAWKGPIQHGTVTIQAVTLDPRVLTIKPARRFQRTPTGFVWNFTNLKPTLDDNIEVCMNDKFFTQMNPRSTPHDNSWYSFEGGAVGRVGQNAKKFYLNFHGYTARATSTAAGYPVSYVGDFDEKTAWVARKNGGINERLTLTLSRPEHVDEIGIIPGYAKSKEIYFANNRIRELEVTVNGHTVHATLPDEYIRFAPWSHKAYQIVNLGHYSGLAKTITLTVKSVYAGRQSKDTCISEVLLRKRLPGRPNIRAMR